MTSLEETRLVALGHSPEQILGIKAYEKEVKRECARKVQDLLVNKVPDVEYTRHPQAIKSAISDAMKELTK